MKEYPKECPFCHVLPDLVKEPLWHGNHGYYGKYDYYVACRNKDCKINPSTPKCADVYGDTEQECFEKVIEYWNDR